MEIGPLLPKLLQNWPTLFLRHGVDYNRSYRKKYKWPTFFWDMGYFTV